MIGDIPARYAGWDSSVSRSNARILAPVLPAGQRRGQVLARMRPLVSDHRLQFLMELSIEPVAAALRAAGTTATVA